MFFSTRIRYGVRALVELGMNYDKGPVLLKTISERQNISLKYLDHIFTSLKINGIIKKIKAKKGGYLLNRAPEDITLYDIIEAIEGIIQIACLNNSQMCERSDICGAKILWKDVNDKINEVLKSITLADFLKAEKKLQHADEHMMFSI
ncbi:MAG TPA: Rrf2 family transcriptional regulator [bacterium]|nr:Rrf2 family transcriptional regulator [bacterium]